MTDRVMGNHSSRDPGFLLMLPSKVSPRLVEKGRRAVLRFNLWPVGFKACVCKAPLASAADVPAPHIFC